MNTPKQSNGKGTFYLLLMGVVSVFRASASSASMEGNQLASSHCPPVVVAGLGTFPICGAFSVPDNLSNIKYIDTADPRFNGINNFKTPVPSIRGESLNRGTTYYYGICGASASEETVWLYNEDYAYIVTIPESESPELCAALAAKAATITTAAPSVFKKLPCLDIAVPGLGSGVFPMCDVFLNPDDSYKCISNGGRTVSLTYGGNFYTGNLCPPNNEIYNSPWALITGPEASRPAAPYPSIYYLAPDLNYFFPIDVHFYITCCSCCLAPSLQTHYDETLFVYTIPVKTAPALCSALGFSAVCSTKPTTRPSIKPKVPTKKPSFRPSGKPSSRPSIKPKTPTRNPTLSARPSIKPKVPSV